MKREIDVAYADGYYDGLRHGKQSSAALGCAHAVASGETCSICPNTKDIIELSTPNGLRRLEPCPFACVNAELGLYQLPDSDSRHVFCRTCGATGPWGDSDQEAERLWNKRGARLTAQQRDDLIDEAERKLRWLE